MKKESRIFYESQFSPRMLDKIKVAINPLLSFVCGNDSDYFEKPQFEDLVLSEEVVGEFDNVENLIGNESLVDKEITVKMIQLGMLLHTKEEILKKRVVDNV